ncbi:hypothetical protein [Clostridium sp. UBA4548]|uniref:hypothetical protein n=1 Tax=Clostridium sp. UBA4548 TaxID=1946361 RepID=UPI0025BAAAE6|nr:hypothetical protein [Clostridium sp. UBA4548]
MEPNIELDSNIRILYCNYSECLANKIKLVCSKVGFSYEGIKWIIYDPQISDIYGNKPNQMQQLWIGSKGKDYGACNSKDTIWISTLAIQRESIRNNPWEKIKKVVNMNTQNDEDLLADVILDEIAHISTGRSHGDYKYDAQLDKFKNLYYNDVVSRVLYNKTKK